MVERKKNPYVENLNIIHMLHISFHFNSDTRTKKLKLQFERSGMVQLQKIRGSLTLHVVDILIKLDISFLHFM